MSGIFGFTLKTDDAALLGEALGGLEYWNRTTAITHGIVP